MGIANIINNSTTTSGGEIVRELVNSSDGAGLHFDGSGVVAFTPVDLGSKFSHEFVLSTSEDLTTGTSSYIVDYHGSSDRFIIGFNPSQDSGNLAIFDNTGWESFGVNPLTDLKVHHIVVTVDGTSAVLYDNGNQVATATISASHGIDSATNAGLAGYYNNSNNFEGTIYRARFYNHTLSAEDVRTAFERADIDYSSQYGSETKLNSSTCVNATSSNAFNTFSGASATGFTAVSTGAGSSSQFAATADEISFVKGKKYSITFDATLNSGTAPKWNAAISILSATETTDHSIATVTAGANGGIFTANQTTTGVISFKSEGGAATNFAISNLKVVRCGVVVDMDLAFASPTQSLPVQDRAGAADGTASASGVTQVQPIIQGNLTSLAVTTSQQSAGVPADGAVVADNVGIGVAPDVKLAIKDNVDNSNESGIRLLRSANSDCGWINMRGGAFNINTRNNAANAGLPVKVKMHGSEVFTIASDGNIEQHTDTNGITKFVVKNENTGTSARALVQAVSDGANMDLWANSASYTGVAGWADSGVISTGSTTSGGMKINAVAGGLSLQTNQTARLTIANSTGLATFSNGVTLSGGILALTDSSGGALPVLTISSGEITITSSVHQVEVESSTTDDLIKINGGTVGAIVMLRPQTSNTVVVKDQASGGNFLLAGDFSMSSNHDTITLLKTGTYWQEISRSDNA